MHLIYIDESGNTGRNLAEMSRDRFPFPVVILMWIVSEIAAMATDLAEFLGGAIGLSLLFGTSLLTGMVITALVTYALLMFDRGGFRPMELIIGGLVGVILHRGEKRHIGLAIELQCVHILQLDVVAVLVGQRDEIGAEFVLHGGNLLC